MRKEPTFPPVSHHKTLLEASSMVVHRASTRHLLVPTPDADQVETAQTLQAGHILSNLILLEADAALSVVDGVLLRGLVRQDRTSELDGASRGAVLT
jgi:hypothetical protein